MALTWTESEHFYKYCKIVIAGLRNTEGTTVFGIQPDN